MSVRPILEYPDPALRQPAVAVTVFDEQLETLIQDLLDTLGNSTGIGLCAPQIGVPTQVLVIDEREAGADPLVFINPTILHAAVPCIVQEHCLSLPELSGHVLRRAEVLVAYQTPAGLPEEVSLSGMTAVCLQHEVDHLEGRLFLDRLTRLKQWWYRRRIKARQQQRAA